MAVNQPRDKAEEIVARVKYLPSLPAVVDKLLMMLDDMDTSAVEIERLVSTDSALASRILKLANSPLYKGVHSVATISQAVTRLGMWKLRDVAVTVSTTGTLAEMADQQIQNAYWHHALFTATCASVLAQETGVPVPEIPFTLGLLHDVGSLVLAAVAPEEYRGFQKLSSARQTEQEMQVFGTTHPRIGSLLLRQWNLPKSLWEGVRLHHNEQVITSNREPVISLVALADMLWRVNHAHAEPPVTARTLQTVARRVDLPLERVAHVLRRVDAEVDTARQDLEIAGDVSFLTSAPASRALRIAVASGHEATAAWLQQCLEYLGHQVLTLADFVDDPFAAEMVVTDPRTLQTRDESVQDALVAREGDLVLLDSGEEVPEVDLEVEDAPRLDLFPGQEQLTAILGSRQTT